jgi:hypothetical protein
MSCLNEVEALERILRDEDKAAARLLRESGRHFRRAIQIQRELNHLRDSQYTAERELLTA